ncbi:MAG: HAD hydrolase family protein [Luminiphilus sp.]|nr:HAD hydrolase family protein [Luminiphilus sp.]
MDQINTAAAKLKLVAMDVDGVLTNGSVTYDSNGVEHKSFSIKDGLGIKLLQRAGLRVAFITGRSSPMVERRAAELGVTDVIQGREDKLTALLEMAALAGCTLEEAAYMGDDLPDLAAVKSAALGACPADAVDLLRDAADYVTTTPGGLGAVREWAEVLLRARGEWQTLIETYDQ